MTACILRLLLLVWSCFYICGGSLQKCNMITENAFDLQQDEIGLFDVLYSSH